MLNIFQNKRSKDIESQIGILQAALDKVNKKLDKKISALALLYKASQDIVSVTDLNILLKAFLDIFIEFSQARTAAVLLEESGEFSVRESVNIGQDAARLVKIHAASALNKALRETRSAQTTDSLSRRFELLEDLAGIRHLEAEVLVPLLYRKELLGIVTLGNFPEKTSLSDEDMELLSALACQMSVAVFNQQYPGKLADLERELAKKDADLINMHRISKVFSPLLDADKLKELTLNLVFETVPVDKVILFLRDEEEILLISVASQGLPKIAENPINIEIDNDFIKKLLNNKKPLSIEATRIKETLDDDKCNPGTAAALADSGLVLYVPFITNERVVALLALGPKRSGEDFTAMELELLGIFSLQLAVIIENAKLFESGVLDGLTNIYNHRFFQQRLEYEIKIGMRYRSRRMLCLVMVDVDHFKDINDAHGHQTGDKILREIARIILNSVRSTDIVARYGGEEFVIIMPEVGLEVGGAIAERIRQAIANFIFLPQELSLKVTASFGVAVYPDNAESKETLIAEADKALYKSKSLGRNRVTLCGA